MRMMIIDDDLQIREGIREGIDWDSLGIAEVRSYGNALDALKELEDFRPEIILSDVRMPGMDGLAFLRQVKKQRADVKVIMISAYSDFAYVKKAMEHGALDYELKPLKFRTLVSLISKTVKLIRAEREEARRHAEHLAHYRQKLLREIFVHQQPIDPETQKIFEQQIHLSDDHSHLCLVLKLVSTRKLSNEIIEQLILSRLTPLVKFDLYLEPEGELVALLKLSGRFSAGARSELRKRIRVLDDTLRAEGIRLSGGAARIHSIGEIPATYRYAKTLLLHTSYLGKGSLMLKRDMREPIEAEEGELQKAQELVITSFVEFDRRQMEKGLTLIRESCIKEREYRAPVVRKSLIECCVQIMHRMGQSTLFDIDRTAKTLSDEFYYEDLFSRMEGLLGTVLETEQKRRSAHFSSMTSSALDYIHEHYREPISAGDVARHISKSPNYFSSVFKKDLSISFKEYVNRLRIQEAERLIREGQEYIYEVADQVGFKDYTYFYQVFKRITGYEPTKLKKG